MSLLLIFLPLVSSIIAGFFGRFLGGKGAGIFTTICIFICWSINSIDFLNILFTSNNTVYTTLIWLSAGSLKVEFDFIFDALTISMLLLVTSISTLVHLYSIEYMGHDPHLPRFMSYLSLFTFFMIILVTANNFLQLFIGWEGVGICSYLLINFWFTRAQANKSAMKALIMNRIGDLGFAIAMFIIFDLFKTLNFSIIFATTHLMKDISINFLNYHFNAFTLIGFFLLIAATGKSAQLGLHAWLPDAMEGPTPVSALIHAATMVTAGVYLLIRCSYILEHTPIALIMIAVLGALTAFFAAIIGLTQNDIKKVIAYSTCSQLGYMIFACGISNYTLSLFHLLNHGFFKALLFLSAGAIIHAMGDEQDLRKFGALIGPLPLTYTLMLIGSLSLMGFPYLSGFYSKDAILEYAITSFTLNGYFAFWLETIAAFFTAFYSFRLLYYTFFTKTNAHLKIFMSAHDSSWIMSLPLVLLALASIFSGYLLKELFIGVNTTFFNDAIFTLFSHYKKTEAESLYPTLKWIPVIFSFLGAILAILLSSIYNKFQYQFLITKLGSSMYAFLNHKWYLDIINNFLFVKPLLQFSNQITYKTIDRGFIEFIGPQGISLNLIKITTKLSMIHSGILYHYAFLIFFSITLFLIILSNINFIPLDIFLILLPFTLLIKQT